MAKAKKLPSGSWRVQVSHTDSDGVKHRESFTEDTAALAEAKAAMWKAGMLVRDRDRTHLSFTEAAKEYIDACRVAGLEPTTLRGYVSMQKNAYKQLSRVPIEKLVLRDVQRWINARAQEVAPKTVRNNQNFLSAVLKANGVSLDFSALKLPKSDRSEMEIPSDAQVTALLNLVYDQDDLFIAVALAALMGLRRSEICALRWSDIEVHDGVPFLTIDKALVMAEDGAYVEKGTKTAAGTRTLVIPDTLYAELKRRRSLRPTLIAATPNALSNRYALRAQKLGIPTRFHNLRHYHASVMLREGVPEKYIVADMGHSSFDMVKRVYGHVMQEKRSLIDTAMNTHATAILNSSHGCAHEVEKSQVK